MALQAEIANCEIAKNGTGVTITFGDGQTLPIYNVEAVVRFPDGTEVNVQAQIKRGWRYEDATGAKKDFCGVVVVIEKASEQTTLKVYLKELNLPDQTGMAASPVSAPVPPVELIPHAGPVLSPTLPTNHDSAQSTTSPETANGAGNVRGPTVAQTMPKTKTRASVKKVRDYLLRLCKSGEPYTSQRELTELIRETMNCSEATVNKAIRTSRELTEWMNMALEERKGDPRAISLNDAYLGVKINKREPSPDERLRQEEDRVMAILIEKAADDPDERAKLHNMSPEKRRETVALYLSQEAEQYIEDKARGGNKIIGRKP